MAKSDDELERRSYLRVNAPITVRPASILARVVPRRVNDVSLGGLRAFSDERYRIGARLELELAFPGGAVATVLAEVVWVDQLEEGSPAHFEVGMRYVDAKAADLDLIRQAIGVPGH